MHTLAFAWNFFLLVAGILLFISIRDQAIRTDKILAGILGGVLILGSGITLLVL